MNILRASAHPFPQDTTPSRILIPPSRITRGPPESPWQASLPPCGNPAQNMFLVMAGPTTFRQTFLARMGTSTARSWSGDWPPADVAPNLHSLVCWETKLIYATHPSHSQFPMFPPAGLVRTWRKGFFSHPVPGWSRRSTAIRRG